MIYKVCGHHPSRWAVILAATLTVSAAPPTKTVRFSPAFEDYGGQADRSARFIARMPGFSVQLGIGGDAIYNFPGQSSSAVRMRFLKAAAVQPLPESRIDASTQYYRRDLRIDNAPHYARIRYRNLYSGIDLLWRQRTGGLEFDLAVRPGADTRNIRFRLEGADGIRIDENGNLLAESADGVVRLAPPIAFQDPGPDQIPVSVRYRVDEDVVSFEVGDYDVSRPLLIDPAVDFSTYLGGSGFDGINATAVDASGNIYVTGETTSASIQPDSTGPLRPNRDIFVAKVSANGSALIYLTVLSATGNDSGNAIAVDASGNVFVTGKAHGAGLPVTAGAVRSTPAGNDDAFAARLDSQGRIVYCTYLGGTGDDIGKAIAVNASGEAFIAGYTDTVQFSTTLTAPQKLYGGGAYDGFLIKLSTLGTAIEFSTLMGGIGMDQANAVTLDQAGNACVTGYSESHDLPLQGSLYSYAGGGDAFVACLNPASAAWILMAYLGGHGIDRASAIAIDSSGNIYVAGHTFSSDFPVTTGAFQQTAGGNYDMFVTKVAAGGALIYSTLIGGAASDSATSIALDSARRVWITGYSASNDFPLRNAWQTMRSGSFEVTVSQLSVDGSDLVLSSFSGGSGDDRGHAIVIDSSGSVLIAGLTFSADLLTTGAAVDRSPGGNGDGFVLKIKPDPAFALSLSPNNGSSAGATFTLLYSDSSSNAKVDVAYLLVNSALTGAQGCLLEYTVSTNSIRLLSASGSGWQGASRLGPSGNNSSINNGLCTIDPSASSATQSGSVFTLNIALRFSAAFNGAKTIYAQMVTAAGVNPWQIVGQWTIPANQPPSATSISPNTGSGASQTFHILLTDTNGADDITTAYILINSAINGSQACFLEYTAASQRLRILADNGSGWVAELYLGRPGAIQNSQCSVSGSGGFVSASGSNLTLTLPVTFKPSFTGTRGIYVSVYDTALATNNWQAIGSWTVRTVGSPPGVVFASPTSGAGRAGSFIVVFSDPDGYSDLQYAYVVVNSTLNGIGACLLEYAYQTNTLRLLSDNGISWRGSVQPGTVASMENSQCALDARASWVSRSGTDLALSLALQFKPSFVGVKQIYGSAYDGDMLTKGWQMTGSWTVQ